MLKNLRFSNPNIIGPEEKLDVAAAILDVRKGDLAHRPHRPDTACQGDRHWLDRFGGFRCQESLDGFLA